MFTGRWWAGTPATERPASSTSPAEGCSKPAIIRRVVVLPQPELPRKEWKEPRRTLKFRPLTAATAP
ncbi:hypothetical protein D3C75_1203830 [compost metagenome]